MEGTPKTDAQRTLSHLRTYVLVHGWASTVAGLFLLAISDWTSFDLLVSAISSVPLFYLVVSGVVLLVARRRISKGDPDAPRWVRWTMAFALPGSLFVGIGATLAVFLGLSTDPSARSS